MLGNMKRALIFALVFCLLTPAAVFSEESAAKPRIYIFGDDWAAEWGEKLKGFYAEEVINSAHEGALLSGLEKENGFKDVSKGDIVILSYGTTGKDRAADSTASFERMLDGFVKRLEKNGSEVVLASICSSLVYNTFTKKVEETKNFYTEAQKGYAAENGILYINLAEATAKWSDAAGGGEIWNNTYSLTQRGAVLCAKQVCDALGGADIIKESGNGGMSLVYEISPGEKGRTFDVSIEKDYCDGFAVYVKGGRDVYVNSVKAKDGNSETELTVPDGRIRVNFTEAEKIQIAPVYIFDAQGRGAEDDPFVLKYREGIFDVAVKKEEALRASVLANGFVIASNLDMPGTEEVTEPSEYVFRSFHLSGETRFTVSGKTDRLSYVLVRESARIFDDEPRIFVGGDSTLCCYYPLLRTGEEKDGTVMTGWAMMLEKYTPSEVINLAASGDWAAKWMEETFPTVEKEGGEGDIFIIQFGINDKLSSSVEEMRSSLEKMIEKTTEKGMIPILVSPQISAGYGWGDAADVGKSDGGEYEEYFSCVRELAKETGCFYVDLTDLSAGWFSEIGREEVYRKYHLWDYEKNEPKDTMHLSAKGADAMASFFATALKEKKEAHDEDAWGHTLDELTLW